MRLVRRFASLIEHQPIEGEFNSFQLLDDMAFQRVRTKHLARRPTSSEPSNAGITFLIALVGAPGCLLAGLFGNDVAYFFGAAFWAVTGTALYAYLAHAAKYWREHCAIRAEEVRRFGCASFG